MKQLLHGSEKKLSFASEKKYDSNLEKTSRSTYALWYEDVPVKVDESYCRYNSKQKY